MGQYGGIIGGVVGAVIGAFAGGNVYAGWVIGSAIGGAYSASQQVIPGPKLGDIQQQTAQEGGPRPIVFGRSHPIAGNVIADGGPRKVTKRERQGKGGPKVESESVYRTYAIGFCEGPIRAFLQVWRNNTLVYDAEDPSMTAENAEFLKYARFFLGGYDQMPSPDLESILGVGNVTAHRGTAYMVLKDEDLTDLRGMWSQWKVRVDATLPDVFVTSRPYPIYDEDSSGVSYRVEGLNLRKVMKDIYPTDESSVGYGLEGIRLKDIYNLTLFDDFGSVGYSADSIVLRQAFATTGPQFDYSGVVYNAESVTLKNQLISTQPQIDKSGVSYSVSEIALT